MSAFADLGDRTLAQLRAEWRKAHKGKVMPDGLGRDLARRGIAWRRQEKISGGHAPAVRRELDRLAAQLHENREVELTKAPPIRPGTKLIREWHGRVHQVLVLDEGFQFEDRLYRSLTRIAREITGAAWSGPRFFGLKEASGGER